MKILRRSGKAEKAVQWAGYLMVAYLLASWGVNGVVNPMHYVKNVRMEMRPINIIEDEKSMILELPLDDSTKKYFLSFFVMSENYSIDLPMVGYLQDGEAQEVVIKVWKGWNSIDLEKLQGAATWNKIIVPKFEQGIKVVSVALSKYRRMETGRMLYIAISFLFLAMFWECIWWMKERYAETDIAK